MSKRRAGWELTAKRGEGVWAQDEAEVRREAWYDERCEWAAATWKDVEGEGGAEMVGEDEVSIATHRGRRLPRVWWLHVRFSSGVWW